MTTLTQHSEQLQSILGESLQSINIALAEITCEIAASNIVEVCKQLRDHADCEYNQLIDLCGMDYSGYGAEGGETWPGSQFAVVYHLLSTTHNRRLRLRVQLDDQRPLIESVIDVWPVANWFEREAFDLFGILFNGHPDLRRLLTDYGFIGHPFRKDFPLSGEVEMRYDEEQQRVIYEPVTIDPRTLVPRVIQQEKADG